MKKKGQIRENLKRYCQRCRQSRIVHWNNAGTARYCSACLEKVEKREPTEAQKASQKRRKLNRKNKVATARAWVETYKAQRGCFYCQESDPICLDCHPQDPSKTSMDIARLVGRKPDLEVLKEELRKCLVLCLNCQRKHHQRLRNDAAEELELVIEEGDLPRTKKVIHRPASLDRPAGFSEVMEDLRRKCFPDPKERVPEVHTPVITSDPSPASPVTDLDMPSEADDDDDPIFGSVATTDS